MAACTGGGAERRSRSGSGGGAAADGTAVARAGQGGRTGRSPGKSQLAEGGGKKEQPATDWRLNRGRQSLDNPGADGGFG